jgi:hypothetical protein
MILCTKCGASLATSATYCSACGHARILPTPIQVLPPEIVNVPHAQPQQVIVERQVIMDHRPHGTPLWVHIAVGITIAAFLVPLVFFGGCFALTAAMIAGTSGTVAATATTPTTPSQSSFANVVYEGMTGEQVQGAMGPPTTVKEWRQGENLYHVWDYPTREVAYRNGKVVQIREK